MEKPGNEGENCKPVNLLGSRILLLGRGMDSVKY